MENDGTGEVNLTSSSVTDNSASDRGGGISIENGATLMMDNTNVAENTVKSAGGGIFNRGSVGDEQPDKRQQGGVTGRRHLQQWDGHMDR